jgi:folate-binding protein YgfZ
VNDSSAEEISRDYQLLCGSGGDGIVERDVIAVAGPDSARYLQGQLSQDVVAMAGDSALSFLLGPNGKVDAWLRVHRLDAENYLLEVDQGWGDVVVARLKRFLLRTKATIGEPQRAQLVQRRWSSETIRLGADVIGDELVVAPIGPSAAGVDLLVLDDADTNVGDLAVDSVSSESIERYRIAHGVPQMGSELTADTIPGEAGEWVIDASVSFTKGCYTGQELVARIDSRGNNVPHPIRLLVLGADAEVGDEVLLDGATVGALTSVTPALGAGFPALALARVGRSVASGGDVTVQSGSVVAPASVVEPGSVR